MARKGFQQDLNARIRLLPEQRDERIYELFEGRKLTKELLDGKEVILKKGTTLNREILREIDTKILRKAEVSAGRIDIAGEVKEYEQRTERQINILRDIYDEKI